MKREVPLSDLHTHAVGNWIVCRIFGNLFRLARVPADKDGPRTVSTRYELKSSRRYSQGHTKKIVLGLFIY